MVAFLLRRNPALPPGSLVLVTDVDGFIASHTANQLLLAGYRVRGTTRDLAKTRWLSDLFDSKYATGKFEMVHVADIGREGAFMSVLNGVDGIIHTAVNDSISTDAAMIIRSVIKGATNILIAASTTPSIKRFIYTSSSTALYMPGLHGTGKQNVSQWTWNDRTVAYVESQINGTQNATAPTPGIHDGYVVYAASKTLAEKAVWTWVDKHSPSFAVNVVIPGMTFGGSLKADGRCAETCALSTFFKSVSREDKGYRIVRNIQPQYFVDVQDAARLHVAALMAGDVQNERLLGFAEPFNWNVVLNIWRQGFPGRTFPGNVKYEGSGWDDSDATTARQRAESVMRRVGYFGFEVSLERSLLKAVEGLS
ncbi:hypothetical protein B0J11DRAFT_553555 [Dendryphion nanum]|uniref:NAD-dependent epimerase/dehydratase domain-containing protein n=1 Tax=Dendryphion nanum TaxID=256645 RepID=A0A9P9D837_9PLEO|nr:hypothetical protein B0J11DRAFT_553555 [Dendryphion nanum]